LRDRHRRNPQRALLSETISVPGLDSDSVHQTPESRRCDDDSVLVGVLAGASRNITPAKATATSRSPIPRFTLRNGCDASVPRNMPTNVVATRPARSPVS